ncbi:thiamin diphosphate-binding fold (THDP-binding)superfamily protein [Striga asiatica]|uniref:Thiamin diphosphate-binding fold (THDP-binding)superfamily protein n=1 Tax=Striga asiatica TaxID=4170 RepID=A0A5A7QAM8_STRAF|nr:thiamin diphosphate-binding fold (THDP-binding)superfamily protein [Striga asiatica]
MAPVPAPGEISGERWGCRGRKALLRQDKRSFGNGESLPNHYRLHYVPRGLPNHDWPLSGRYWVTAARLGRCRVPGAAGVGWTARLRLLCTCVVGHGRRALRVGSTSCAARCALWGGAGRAHRHAVLA